jgi:hypothetical protein
MIVGSTGSWPWAPGSVVLTELIDHSGATLVQGQPLGLDKQPDRAGAVYRCLLADQYVQRSRLSAIGGRGV